MPVECTLGVAIRGRKKNVGPYVNPVMVHKELYVMGRHLGHHHVYTKTIAHTMVMQLILEDLEERGDGKDVMEIEIPEVVSNSWGNTWFGINELALTAALEKFGYCAKVFEVSTRLLSEAITPKEYIDCLTIRFRFENGAPPSMLRKREQYWRSNLGADSSVTTAVFPSPNELVREAIMKHDEGIYARCREEMPLYGKTVPEFTRIRWEDKPICGYMADGSLKKEDLAEGIRQCVEARGIGSGVVSSESSLISIVLSSLRDLYEETIDSAPPPDLQKSPDTTDGQGGAGGHGLADAGSRIAARLEDALPSLHLPILAHFRRAPPESTMHEMALQPFLETFISMHVADRKLIQGNVDLYSENIPPYVFSSHHSNFVMGKWEQGDDEAEPKPDTWNYILQESANSIPGSTAPLGISANVIAACIFLLLQRSIGCDIVVNAARRCDVGKLRQQLFVKIKAWQIATYEVEDVNALSALVRESVDIAVYFALYVAHTYNSCTPPGELSARYNKVSDGERR